ncbi:lytic polysaccharide monooxygenase auxiliary activity family 9 protein [Streptomyces smyrnaeus]|uniref:Lytic polysaccharide monooxygenase n=1 Tax=Streptomyces smyrnaeus TaxID=1387713 RepID=A0ABS3XZL2_9ACTN|nr:lytic polysaccharide monooxygenase auxiliary activity family 9 protein [Streptomyces smyrnaeus]MBO8200770.1 lytic polysaccharide monooxygenase [Streptomyces smyrnaeus]
MQSHVSGSSPRHAVRAVVLLAAAMLFLLPWAQGASAHGSVVDPASRNYGCWERWGDDHLNPDMATEDPMCWQAWQDDPNAMWNWNGLYRNGVGGDHQGAIPDGQLCSGGQTEGGRYNSLDAVGAWKTTDVTDDFTVELYDQASHGADYFQVYVTKQGFDPTTQAIGWDDLELVAETGSYAPANTYSIPVSTSGYDGRHVVYTIWKASHMDQTYYLCSDVNFG